MALPSGALFNPTDLGLVRTVLRDKVEKNESFIITTLDLYKDDPWRLDHVSNRFFEKKEWYYFVPRTKRGGKTANRTVPGRGKSEGGSWKSTGKKTKILDDGDKRVMGYKQSLVYIKKAKGKPAVKTDWLMTEYTLRDEGEPFEDLVLCWIREKKETKDDLVGFVDQEEAGFDHDIETMMLEGERGDVNQQQQQQQQQEADFANVFDKMMMMLKGYHGVVNQQQQQDQEDTPFLPPPLQSNGNNFDLGFVDQDPRPQEENNMDTILPNQEQEEAGLTGFANEIELMLEGEGGDGMDNILPNQEQEGAGLTGFADEIEMMLEGEGGDGMDNILPNQEQEGAGLTGFADEIEMMLEGEGGDGNKQQQEEQEMTIHPPPQQSNDNNVMMMLNQEEYPWDMFEEGDDDATFDIDELLKMLDEYKKATTDS